MRCRPLATAVLAWVIGFAGDAMAGPNDIEGPQPSDALDLDDSMEIALQHNRAVKRARAELRRVGGTRLIEKSRFLPHVDVLGSYDRTRSNSEANVIRDRSVSLRLSQRLFEFGRDPASLVSLRQDQRDAFFALESVAADVLRQVRETFFTILVRQRQLRTRERNLAEFQETLRRQEKRFEKRESERADVLTAELSVSQEELRINSLERDLNNLKFGFMQLLGRPIGMEVRLVGERQPFTLTEEESVAVGLRNSVSIAVAKEVLAEQRRVVSEVKTGYYPDLSVRSGVENKRDVFAVDLSRDGTDDVWGVDVSAERFFIRPNSRFQQFQDPNNGFEDVGDDYVWFVNVDVVVPIFQGFERKGELVREKARLKQLGIDLDNQVSIVELGIRQAHQRLQEQRETVRLQEQTLEISRKRLDIIQKLREFGRATEDDVENFRRRLFDEQDRLFAEQDRLIREQENVRAAIRLFE